jgi:hypothetical protein
MVFQVKKNKVASGGQSGKYRRRRKAGSFDSPMDTLAAKTGQERLGKIALRQDLAAAQRNPAAGFLVEHPILKARRSSVRNAQRLSGQGQRLPRTRGAARAASGTAQVVYPYGIRFNGYGLFWTPVKAGPASDALGFIPENLYLHPLRFGIGTPEAGEGASFQEHGGSDPRPVMDTVFLYVENNAAHTP